MIFAGSDSLVNVLIFLIITPMFNKYSAPVTNTETQNILTTFLLGFGMVVFKNHCDTVCLNSYISFNIYARTMHV